MNKIPFVHLFENVSGKYFFDVNKNVVVEVSDDLYDIIYKWIHYGWEMVQNDLSPSLQNAIQKLISEGFLSDNKPEIICHPLSEWSESYLENNLNRLILQVTQNCNMRCQYCNFSGDGILSRTHQNKNMTSAVALRSVDFFQAHSRNSSELEISFYGGEPLLVFPTIVETVNYAQKILGDKRLKFSLTTNGTVFSNYMISFLAEKNFILTISVDGPAPYHDVNRRMSCDGSGSFSKIYANLARIKKLNPQYYSTIEFNAVVEPDRNLNEIEAFFNTDPLFKDNHIVVNRVNDSLTNEKYEATEEYMVEQEALTFKALLQQIVLRTTKYYSKNIDIINSLKYTMNPMKPIPNTTHHQGPCLPGYNRLFVDINGIFRICEKASELSEHMIIGSLDQGFDYEKIDRLLNIGKLNQEQCLNCWLIRHCRICPTAIDNINELSKEIKERYCMLQKKQFVEKLNDYTIYKKTGILS